MHRKYYLNNNIVQKSLLAGVGFGFLFPVIAIVIEIHTLNIEFKPYAILAAHSNNILLYIIDTAPLFLGLLAYISGWHQAKLQESNKRLENEILTDELTKIHNRLFGKQKLSELIRQAKNKNHRIGLIFIDLDRFKSFNDNMGHYFGDQLLTCLAQKLKKNMRKGEYVARLGGDEFMIITENISNTNPIDAVAQHIVNLCSAEFKVSEKSCWITTSMGISIFPDHGEDMESLFKHADVALYENKKNKRSPFEIFSKEMLLDIHENFLLEKGLQHAIENHELTVHYQPILDTHTQAIIAAEALLRWHSKLLGPVSPAKFIPIAESTNLILEIGEWVLMESCKQAKIWHDMGMHPITISVNVSANQLTYQHFTHTIQDILEKTKLDPHFLKLEITETASMENIGEVCDIFQELKNKNIRLSIDDFGTGYSSLAKLKSLSVDDLKIDKSFIDDIKIDSDIDQPALVEAIIAMANKLKISVVAEGVETTVQHEALKKLNCDYVQGYLFSKPLCADDFTALLIKNRQVYPG